jgi:transposase
MSPKSWFARNYRHFDNQRQAGSFLGLTPSPYDSGEEERCHGISRAGIGRVRAVMIEAAWLWVQHQPKNALTRYSPGHAEYNASSPPPGPIPPDRSRSPYR